MESGRSEHCGWAGSKAGLSWTPSGENAGGRVPREGSTDPRDTETGEELSHRLGFGAAQSTGWDGGARSRSGRTGLPGSSAQAELQPPSAQTDTSLAPSGWTSQGDALLGTAHVSDTGPVLPCSLLGGGPTRHQLSHCREWGASPTVGASPGPDQTASFALHGFVGTKDIERQAVLLCRC